MRPELEKFCQALADVTNTLDAAHSGLRQRLLEALLTPQRPLTPGELDVLDKAMSQEKSTTRAHARRVIASLARRHGLTLLYLVDNGNVAEFIELKRNRDN